MNYIKLNLDMTALVGKSLFEVWKELCHIIDEKYDMEHLWNKGGKAWLYAQLWKRRTGKI